MKKTAVVFGLLFFLCLNLNVAHNFCYATNNENLNYHFVFKYQDKTFNFHSSEFENEIFLSEMQKQLLKNHKSRAEMFPLIEDFGLTEQEKMLYIFPELKPILNQLSNKLNIAPTPSDIQVLLNTCKINFKEGNPGRFLDMEDFFKKLQKQVLAGSKKISFTLKMKEYQLKDNLKSDFVEKSQFSTNFSTSSAERKNNIKTALANFDGLVLNEGETLSFNQTTGLRTENNGYKKAKIISGGTFVEGFGGGVCQVSTTLYNACLLAGLEIIEVHQHSLPVGYVEPSFDAMVNAGSSDLVIRNNSGGKLIFTASSKGDVCKVKIYGKKNKYKITRVSEKTKVIPSVGDVIETNPQKHNIENLQPGEEKRISYPKDGYESKGYLNFYNADGTLSKTQKIRENKYAPTKGIVVKSVA